MPKQETADELLETFSEFVRTYHRSKAPIALAVSGGGDSMALLALAIAHRKRAGWGGARGEKAGEEDAPDFICFTVDHCLRPESAVEAQSVADTCRRLSIPHEILQWQGEKPSAGLPAAARTARYRLLIKAVQAAGADLLLTGHTAEDQAETVFANLARGSAGAGLAGMAGVSKIAHGAGPPIRLGRPLLKARREALRAHALAEGMAVADDPSNEDTSYERVRRRRALLKGEAEGLLSVAALCRTAASQRVLADAHKAQVKSDFDHCHGCVSGAGAISFSAAKWQGLPAGRRTGLLRRLVFAVSDLDVAPGLEKTARVAQALIKDRVATLGGVLLRFSQGQLTLCREPAALLGRAGVTPYSVELEDIAPGELCLWDRRMALPPQDTLNAEEYVYVPLGKFAAEQGFSLDPGLLTLPVLARKACYSGEKPSDPAKLDNLTPVSLPIAAKMPLMLLEIPWNSALYTLNVRSLVPERLWDPVVRF